MYMHVKYRKAGAIDSTQRIDEISWLEDMDYIRYAYLSSCAFLCFDSR